MCPTTCDLYVCNNPKAVNPATGDIVFLARENSTGKLVWMKAEEGMTPPPDQIISRAPIHGGIPEELISKLQKVDCDSAPVLLLHGSEGVNLSSLPQVGGNGEGIMTSVSPTTIASSSAVTTFTGGKRRSSFDGSDLDTDTDKSSSKRSPVEEDENNEKDALFLPPLARSSSSSSSTGITSSSSSTSKANRTSKRRKMDIKHRKLKKPKHPKTGYNFFQMSIRDKLVDKIPMDDRVLHNETVARIIGKKWKALSKQERKVFQTLAEQDKTRYEHELKDYLQKMYELGADTRSIVESRDQKKKAHLRRCFSFDGAMSGRLVSRGKKKRSSRESSSHALTQSEAVSVKDASEKKLVDDVKNKRKRAKLEEGRRRDCYGTVDSDGSMQSSKRLGSKVKGKKLNKHLKQEETPNGNNNYLEGKLKLGQQITNALGMPTVACGDKMLSSSSSSSSATTTTTTTTPFLSEQWLNDAFSIPWGKDSNSAATTPSRIRSSLSCENLPLSSNPFDPAGFFDKPSSTFSVDRKHGGGGVGAIPFDHPADDLYLSNFRDSTLIDSSGIGGSVGSSPMMMKSSPAFPSLPNMDNYFFKELSTWDADC